MTYDMFSDTNVYGVMHHNTEHPNVSEYYVTYDDGQEYAVFVMEAINLVSREQ